jgi:hypothetical protein
MKSLVFLLLSVCLLNINNYGQTGCGTDQANQYQMIHNPAFAQAIADQNEHWVQATQASNIGLIVNTANGPVYEIPLVIHIIHSGQALGSVENPTDATIISLVDYLNDVYAATWISNPDTNSGGVYVPIRFKLAARTSSCTATNGITRNNGSVLSGFSTYGIAMSGATNGAPEVDVKALNIWPNTDYLNIWIVPYIQGSAANGGAVAGYAYFPGTASDIDGVVLRADQTDWAIAHEVGHSLGLYHTFQGSSSPTTCPTNTNCTSDGDLVCDTDPHPLVSGCPTGTNPCTSTSYVPVVYNIMNYSSCPDRFTTGQRDRMVYMLLNYRSSLLTSLGVNPPGTNPTSVDTPSLACVPSAISNVNNTYDVGPRNVTLADLFSSSAGYSNDGFEFYVDHTVSTCLQGQSVAHLQPNTSYPITVTTGFNPENVRAWIDFNNDSTFQASELIMSSDGASSFETHTDTVVIPTTGFVSCTPLRMRIASDFYGSASPQACSSPDYGQVEDFIVIIQSAAPAVAISATDTTICSGSSVTFTATATNGGSSPSFQWKKNGVNVGSNSASYTTATLANGDVITCTLTSSSSCVTSSVVTSSGITMVVNMALTPTIGISASSTSICSGASVTFTATATNGGSSPTYQWKKNGVNVGTNSTGYTTSSLLNGDVVTCKLTSSSSCASPSAVTSSGITMTVNALLTPSVSIAASTTTICAGTSVTFTATPVNGGSSPVYQWKKNGANVGTNSATYTSTLLVNGDVISCQMTGNSNCASMGSITSSGITMTVSPVLVPAVSVAASDTTICSGVSVSFTATPAGGGSSPLYQWKKNGINVGTNSATYTSTSLVNGDVITCQMTSSAACASMGTANSTPITMVVNANTTPSVSISASVTTICAGTAITFTATPVNGGSSPTYQWKRNGNNVGANSATFTSSSLSNGDVITCQMTSSVACSSPLSVSSSGITITVNPMLTPDVSVSVSASVICIGTSVICTATPVNGGSNPAYQWKVNGVNVGTNSSGYTSSTWVNGDVITCEMTSNASCLSATAAISAPVTMTVNPIVTPAVNISASDSVICAGASVSFFAIPTNGGSGPDYQWQVNGNNAGGNNAVFTSTVLADNDVVSCIMTSNASCLTVTTDTSAAVTMTVNPLQVPEIAISANDTDICSGSPITFTATSVHGGNSPVYQWKNNGVNAGTNSPTYTSSALNDGDVIICILTSDALCASPASVTSAGISMTVHPEVQPSIAIETNTGTTVNAGTTVVFRASVTNPGSDPQYQWRKNGVVIPGEDTLVYVAVAGSDVLDGDEITAWMHSDAACAVPDSLLSNGLTMQVNPVGIDEIAQAPGNKIRIYPNPNDGHFILEGTFPGGGKYNIRVTDVLGRELYRSGGITGSEFQQDISLKSLAQGTYYLLFYLNDEQVSRNKFMKTN